MNLRKRKTTVEQNDAGAAGTSCSSSTVGTSKQKVATKKKKIEAPAVAVASAENVTESSDKSKYFSESSPEKIQQKPKAKEKKTSTKKPPSSKKSSKKKPPNTEEENVKEILNKEDKIEMMLRMETKQQRVKEDEIMMDEDDLDEDYDDSSDEYDPRKDMKRKRNDGNGDEENDDDDDDDDEDDDDFEEVEMDANHSGLMPKIKAGNLEIKVDAKAKKKNVDRAAQLERMRKLHEKRVRIMIHKLHLHCWIGHGYFLNRICRSSIVRAMMLSVQFKFEVDDQNSLNSILDENLLLNLVKNLNKTFHVEQYKSFDDFPNKQPLVNKYSTIKAIETSIVDNYLQYVIIVLTALRSFNIKSRLCVCFDVFPLTENKKTAAVTKKSVKISSKQQTDKSQSKTKKIATQPQPKNETKSKSRFSKRQSSKSALDKLKNFHDSSEEEEENAAEGEDENDSSFGKDFKEIIKSKKKITTASSKSKLRKVARETSSSDDDDKEKVAEAVESESESEKEEKSPEKNRPTEKNYQILSGDDTIVAVNNGDGGEKRRRERCYWLEVYLESAQIWIPLEPLSLKVNQLSYFEKRFGAEILYVCAFDQDNRVKEITTKYSSNWFTSGRFNHINNFDDKLWWSRILITKQSLDAQIDMKEDKDIKKMLLARPIPQSVSVLKNHPLYVLKRHLLKFQAIYPPNALPLTHLQGGNNEPIYSRDNLVYLHSRQTWLKLARVVKPYEKAYKIVKGRLKHSEYKAGYRDNPDLDLFGYWQTQQYEPPRAYGGKVPRNEFGNVELFLPHMLPRGCVHLRLPNLNKICRKLNIDCAAAVVGFDAHGGFSHAVTDGWVVCEEFKEVVLAAQEEDERQANIRMVQMHQEKVMNNWKHLIKSLLIRERLKLKYEAFNTETDVKKRSQPPLPKKQPSEFDAKDELGADDNDDDADNDDKEKKSVNQVIKQSAEEEPIGYYDADDALKNFAKNFASKGAVSSKSSHDDESNKILKEAKIENRPAAAKKAVAKKTKTKTITTTTSKKESAAAIEETRKYPKRQTRNKKQIILFNADDDDAENEEDSGSDDQPASDANESSESDYENVKPTTRSKKRQSGTAVKKESSHSSTVKKRKRFNFDVVDSPLPESNSNDAFSNSKAAVNNNDDDLNLSEEDE